MEIRLSVVPFGFFTTPRRGKGKVRCLTCGHVIKNSSIWAEAWSEEQLVGYVCRDCPELQEQLWKEAMRDHARKRHARMALLDRLLGEKEYAALEVGGVHAIEPGRDRYEAERTLYASFNTDTYLGTVRVAD